MSRDDVLLLHDMLDAIKTVEQYTASLTREEFVSTKMLQDAVVRNLEIIGEAAGHVSQEILDEHPKIDWPDIIGLRHRLIHGYFHVDVELLWEIVRTDIPVLKIQIEQIHIK